MLGAGPNFIASRPLAMKLRRMECVKNRAKSVDLSAIWGKRSQKTEPTLLTDLTIRNFNISLSINGLDG